MTELPGLLRFGVIGTVGFLVDVATFALLIRGGMDPYAARALSFPVAVAVTYSGNRAWTFRDAERTRPALYFFTQMLGLGVNMLVFAAVIHYPVWLPGQYYAGLAAGSLVSMFITYHLSRKHVFHEGD